MRVLLIGGNGFIGSPLTRQLVTAGHQVAILHRNLATSQVPSSVDHILGDRNRLSSSKPAIGEFRPHAIIDLILSSAEQAKEVVRVASELQARLVVISSMDVYRAWGILQGVEPGPFEPLPITEESRLRSHRQLYPAESIKAMQQIFSWVDERYDKVAVEETILMSQVPSTVLRLPMIYGPGDPLERFLPIWKRISDRRTAMIFSEQIAAWRGPRGYVEDVAHGIALSLTERAIGRVYNLCQEPCLSELEWHQRIANEANWHGKLVVLAKKQIPAHLVIPGNFAQQLVASSKRIREELGYGEVVSTEEAIRRTLAWHKSHVSEVKLPWQQFDYEAEDRALAQSA